MRNPLLSAIGAVFLAANLTHAQQPIRELACDTQSVRSVAFSPGDKTIVAECCHGQFQLWDVETGKLRDSWKVKTDTDFDSSITGWRKVADKLDTNLTSAALDSKVQFACKTQCVLSWAIDPAGLMLAACGWGRVVEVFDNKSGEKKWDLRFPRHSRATNDEQLFVVWSPAFHPTSTVIAAGSSEGDIRCWSTKTGRPVANMSIGAGHGVSSIAFQPNGKLLAAGYYDRRGDFENGIAIFDASDGSLWRRLKGHSYDVTCVAFSSDGKLLASVSGLGWFTDEIEEPLEPWFEIKLWNLETGMLVGSIEAEGGQASSVAFSPNGKLLVTGHCDDLMELNPTGTIRVWEVEKLANCPH
jgi:WD40 repeat protein